MKKCWYCGHDVFHTHGPYADNPRCCRCGLDNHLQIEGFEMGYWKGDEEE